MKPGWMQRIEHRHKVRFSRVAVAEGESPWCVASTDGRKLTDDELEQIWEAFDHKVEYFGKPESESS